MSIKVIVCENYEDVSRRAAAIVGKQIKENPCTVLGLATGSTPLGLYAELGRMHKEEGLDFSRVVTYNLDEYYPISPENDQSYRYFMNKNLFSLINIPLSSTHVPFGGAEDSDKECADYDRAIEAAGGIDLQVLGIGVNGHIGFNEPDDALIAATHKTPLTESTVDANSRFFASKDEVPRYALTMGMASILQAKKIVMLITGANKREALSVLLSGKITTGCPASLLNLHNDTVILCDAEAYGK